MLNDIRGFLTALFKKKKKKDWVVSVRITIVNHLVESSALVTRRKALGTGSSIPYFWQCCLLSEWPQKTWGQGRSSHLYLQASLSLTLAQGT